ncbi:MAG: aromatic acid decarboxylase, partial [Aquificae bacterium]|nr:aromatic acid decarboxylase [Aquificota bacterium]
AVASGAGRNLIHRACDAALKEGVPLLLALREMPQNGVHLRNLLLLQQLGARAFVLSPPFYGRPQSLEELVDATVGKLFDLLGIEHDLYPAWGE